MKLLNVRNFLMVLMIALLSACSAGGAPAETNQPPVVPTSSTSQPTATTYAPLPTATITTTSILPITADSTQTVSAAKTTPTTQAEETVSLEQTTPTPRIPLDPESWSSLPVIPEVSENTKRIFQRGLELGRNPQAFSKIGDCQNVSSYFLSPFAYPNSYNLGPYSTLQETIDWFNKSDSFTRDSLAVKGGFNVAAVLSPLRANPDFCQAGENPLQCEIRVHNPSFAIVSMETWWSGQPENYERYMRQLLDQTIELGVIPILATKADNLEGENQINKALAELAWDYDIPLWNFWASVQTLPDKGLTSDGFHLTLGDYFYNNTDSSASGWSLRNLTALQALDAVRRGVNAEAPTP